jgi:DNA repair protein RadC
LTLYHNAADVIFAHKHTSGVGEISLEDEMLTDSLKKFLAFDVFKALDDFIVAGTECMSFAERGLI